MTILITAVIIYLIIAAVLLIGISYYYKFIDR